MTQLTVEQVIFRSAKKSTEDIEPLLKYLKYKVEAGDLKSMEAAREIADCLRKTGSNDFATLFRGGEGVDYAEIVIDVGEKLGIKGLSMRSEVEVNEGKIFEKMFADALDLMSLEERRTLFKAMNVYEPDWILVGKSGVVTVQHLVSHFGGFATYRLSLIVANIVSRAILGSGLSFAANAALTRVIGTLLGPAGWIATGAWLAADLAGPAYRKTVPAVLYVGMLRQMLMNKVTIGVVGNGSAGKDSLIQRVFGIPVDIDPVAGSTAEAVTYAIGTNGVAEVINYPGFNDYRAKVNQKTTELLHHTDLFLMVVDVSGGISGSDTTMLDRLAAFECPVLICLNKIDLIRNPEDQKKLLDAAKKRFRGYHIIETIFDPDPRLGFKRKGSKDVYDWVKRQLAELGKESGARGLNSFVGDMG